MKNGYKLLTILTDTLNKNTSLINNFINEGKENFSNNDEHILVGLSMIKEIGDIVANLDEGIFILSKKLYELISSISNYSKHLLNDYRLVNSYKLYDALKFDVLELKEFLNTINKN